MSNFEVRYLRTALYVHVRQARIRVRRYTLQHIIYNCETGNGASRIAALVLRIEVIHTCRCHGARLRLHMRMWP